MSDALRELQLEELSILKEIKRVCEKNQIRYFLASGTLLGAVRHRGFIPWDDDIDIEMPYEDYLRFQKIAQEELGERFFVQTSETDPYYAFPYLRVQKKNTALLREWDKIIPGNHWIWIDVFPLVDLGGDRDYRIKRLLLKTAAFLRMDETAFDLNRKWLKSKSGFFQYMLVVLARTLPKKFRWKIRKFLLRFVFRVQNTPDVTFVWTTVTRRIPREVYDEPDEMMWFEDDYYPVPKGYDTYLRILYKDYTQLPPAEKRKPRFSLAVSFEREWVSDSNCQWEDFEWKTIEGQK